MVLIDAGLGPHPEVALQSIAAQLGIDRQRLGLVGNARLGPVLVAHAVSYDAIDVVCISHLHADHVGCWRTPTDHRCSRTRMSSFRAPISSTL
jgi:glyoxylase-like metal-dependent hydrolase (beta-lactamase superfamily II)